MSQPRAVLYVSLLIFGLAVAPLSADTSGKQAEIRPLPPGAIARLGSLRLRHEYQVGAIAFSPDSRMIASRGVHPSMIRVWDVATGKLLHEIDAPGMANSEDALAFTPDGKAIGGVVKGDVCFYDLRTGKIGRRFSLGGKAVPVFTFAGDGKSFYCGGAGGSLHQFDVGSGKQLRCWRGRDGETAHAELKAISPDGRSAAWRFEDWKRKPNPNVVSFGLEIWDLASGKMRCRITDKQNNSLDRPTVAFSANGQHLAGHNGDREIIVWNAWTGKKARLLGDGQVLAYSPDSRCVAGFRDQTGLCIWDMPTGQMRWCRTVAPWYAGWGGSLVFSPDASVLALAYAGNVLLWDASSGREMLPLEGHRWPVTTVAFSPAGTLISQDQSAVCTWDPTRRQTERHGLIAYHGHSLSTAESHIGNLRIFQPEGKPSQLRELISDKVVHEFTEIEGRDYRGCFSTDGRTAALSRFDGRIFVLDIPSRAVRCRVAGLNLIERPILNYVGSMLAVPRWDETVVLIDTRTGKLIRSLGKPKADPIGGERRDKFSTGVFSPDGQLVAFATYVEAQPERSGTFEPPVTYPVIRVWHVATGRELRQLKNCLPGARYGTVHSLRFSPDGNSLAVGLQFNPYYIGDPEHAAAVVLEVASGRVRRRFMGHTAQVASLDFSPDGKILATGSHDSTILLWDMDWLIQPLAEPSAKTWPYLWKQLAACDAAQAYDAVLMLAKKPRCAALLAQELKPIAAPETEKLAGWIAALDDPSFSKREESYAKLTRLHELALPEMRRALRANISLEARRRIKRLVESAEAMNSPTALRDFRALEILARLDCADAHRLLRRIANGSADAFLTLAARDALSRLQLKKLPTL